MFRIRPICQSDLDRLSALAHSAGPGMSSLPDDRDYLKSKIDDSLRAFDERVRKPGGEAYIFVLEDMVKKEILGTSGLVSKIGGFEPFYTYEIETKEYKDQILKIDKTLQLLKLKTAHDGPSELCSLFIDPHRRQVGQGRLLSLCRFLFMAAFPHRFAPSIICELRGVVDEKGRSPFWETVGKHFFDTDYSNADRLSGLGQKEFIKNLMPKYPIYVPMLPKEVQEVIGEVHPKTQPALHMLEQEGFTFAGEVDIFDAGPTLIANTQEVRAIKESQLVTVSSISAPAKKGSPYLASNEKLDFRACLIQLNTVSDTVDLQADAAQALEVQLGDKVRLVRAKKG